MPGGERSTNNAESANSPESNDDEERLAQRKIGAKVLASVGFDKHWKDIVEPYFNKARKNGEKLSGKNNERRNYAYLSRLEDLVDKHGNALEKKLSKARQIKRGMMQQLLTGKIRIEQFSEGGRVI